MEWVIAWTVAAAISVGYLFREFVDVLYQPRTVKPDMLKHMPPRHKHAKTRRSTVEQRKFFDFPEHEGVQDGEQTIP